MKKEINGPIIGTHEEGEDYDDKDKQNKDAHTGGNHNRDNKETRKSFLYLCYNPHTVRGWVFSFILF